MSKKILSVFLSVLMLLPLLSAGSAPAYAATVASGSIGTCTYTIDSDGTLTLDGSGDTGDFGKLDNNQVVNSPISGYEIKKLIVGSNVNRLGNNCLDQYGIEEIYLSEGIETIADNVFPGDTVRRLNIPDSLEYIGDGNTFFGVRADEIYIENNDISNIKSASKYTYGGQYFFDVPVLKKEVATALSNYTTRSAALNAIEPYKSLMIVNEALWFKLNMDFYFTYENEIVQELEDDITGDYTQQEKHLAAQSEFRSIVFYSFFLAFVARINDIAPDAHAFLVANQNDDVALWSYTVNNYASLMERCIDHLNTVLGTNISGPDDLYNVISVTVDPDTSIPAFYYDDPGFHYDFSTFKDSVFEAFDNVSEISYDLAREAYSYLIDGSAEQISLGDSFNRPDPNVDYEIAPWVNIYVNCASQTLALFESEGLHPTVMHEDNDNNGVCDRCGLGATFGEWNDNGNGTHSRNIYRLDGSVDVETESHTDSDNDKVCDKCGLAQVVGNWIDNGNGTHSRQVTDFNGTTVTETEPHESGSWVYYDLFSDSARRECYCSKCSSHVTEALPKREVSDFSNVKANDVDGVEVDYPNGTFDDDVQMVTQHWSFSDVANDFIFEAWYIDFTKNGVSVQPSGPVILKLRLPAGIREAIKSQISLWHYYNGQWYELQTWFEGDYICCVTDCFSPFAFKIGDAPSTPDFNSISIPGQGQPEQESNCVCGQYHTGPFAGLIKLIHRIVYFFKNLF